MIGVHKAIQALSMLTKVNKQTIQVLLATALPELYIQLCRPGRFMREQNTLYQNAMPDLLPTDTKEPRQHPDNHAH